MKRFNLSVLLTLLSMNSLPANDGVYFTSGNFLQPIKETNMAQWKSTGDVFFVSWYFVSLHYEHT